MGRHHCDRESGDSDANEELAQVTDRSFVHRKAAGLPSIFVFELSLFVIDCYLVLDEPTIESLRLFRDGEV
jgi:hypothetical protein